MSFYETVTVNDGVSAPDEPGIYIIRRNEEILYIGRSTSIRRRCSQYIITNDAAVEIECELIESDSERRRRERKLITEHEPRLNRAHNPSRNDYDRRTIIETGFATDEN